MEKVEYVLYGSFDDIVKHVTKGVLAARRAARLEGSSDFEIGRVRGALLVFEHYGWSTQTTLSVAMVGNDESVLLTAVPTGQSGARAKNKFLKTLGPIVEDWHDHPSNPSEPFPPGPMWGTPE